MAYKLYDLAVKVSEYTNNRGEKKGRWQNVGAVMKGDDGNSFIMLAKWFNPAGVQDLSGRGGESLLLSMFKPKEQDAAAPAQAQQAPRRQAAPAPQSVPDFDDDLPF